MKDNIILIHRYLQVYIELNQPVMAASLCLELGNALKVKLRVTASSRWISCSHVMLKLWISTNIVASGHPLVFPQEMNRPGEAIVHYQRAAELQTQTPIEALLSMGDMATCKILTREYSLSFDPRWGPVHLCHVLVLTLCLVWLFFLRGLRWCFVSVYRHAADVPGERTAVTRHQHTSWWEHQWFKWFLT